MTERHEIVAAYSRGADAILEAIDDSPREAWGWKPTPAEWSIDEILWHCAECEAVFHSRTRLMWIGPERTIVAFEQDDWAATPGYAGLPADVAIEVLRSTRQMTSLLIAGIPDDAWQAEGPHTEYGTTTLEDLVLHASEHLDIHAGQIRDNVKAWRAAGEPVAARRG